MGGHPTKRTSLDDIAPQSIQVGAIALVGHWFEIPNFGTPQPWMSTAVAGALAFVGMMFWRRPEGL